MWEGTKSNPKKTTGKLKQKNEVGGKGVKC
jgi:hypothetical protein